MRSLPWNCHFCLVPEGAPEAWTSRADLLCSNPQRVSLGLWADYLVCFPSFFASRKSLYFSFLPHILIMMDFQICQRNDNISVNRQMQQWSTFGKICLSVFIFLCLSPESIWSKCISTLHPNVFCWYFLKTRTLSYINKNMSTPESLNCNSLVSSSFSSISKCPSCF